MTGLLAVPVAISLAAGRLEARKAAVAWNVFGLLDFAVAGFVYSDRDTGRSATSLAQLVIYRVLQGVCGAALVPLSLSVLLHVNPRERHALANTKPSSPPRKTNLDLLGGTNAVATE